MSFLVQNCFLHKCKITAVRENNLSNWSDFTTAVNQFKWSCTQFIRTAEFVGQVLFQHVIENFAELQRKKHRVEFIIKSEGNNSKVFKCNAARKHPSLTNNIIPCIKPISITAKQPLSSQNMFINQNITRLKHVYEIFKIFTNNRPST